MNNKPIDNQELLEVLRSLISQQSSGNSTTTPLASGATFTGEWEKTNHSDVGISMKTDNSGTLFLEFSNDGFNADSILPSDGFTITANVSEFHTAVKFGRYFRVRLVNDTGAQTFLRLFTYYGTFRQGNIPANRLVNDDSDSTLVRNFYEPIDIARGNIASVETYSKFGQNSSVGTSITPVTTSAVYRTPTTVTSLEILSSDANDVDTTGSGARTVKVIGLDSNWLEIEETVSMNGVTPVALSNSFFRVYRMFVISSGTYADINTPTASHAGTITLRETGAGDTWAEIPFINSYGVGQSFIGCYTVPADKQFYIETLEISSSTTKTASILLFIRDNVDDVTAPFSGGLRAIRSFERVEGAVSVPLAGLSLLGPKTDVIIGAYTSTGTSSVSCAFDGYLLNVN